MQHTHTHAHTAFGWVFRTSGKKDSFAEKHFVGFCIAIEDDFGAEEKSATKITLGFWGASVQSVFVGEWGRSNQPPCVAEPFFNGR